MRSRVLTLILAWLLPASGLFAQNKKVLVMSRLGPESFKRMQDAVPNVTLIQGGRDSVAQQVMNVDGVIGPLQPALALKAPNLKWIQVESAGVEQFTFTPGFAQTNITLTNCKIVQGPEIADHAFGLLLALTRGINIAIRSIAKEEWPTQAYNPIELRGKTAIVIGVGGIGTQIAIRAHASGMTVIGVDPKDIPYTNDVARIVTPDQLDSVIPSADVVFVSAPLTPQSMKMMGAREFELMKQNSYFVAVSRGRLYDTDALVKALDSKKLAGAALDVTDPEPLPKGHPLWKFPNVVITPHIAGRSDHVSDRDEELFIENLKRFAAGRPLLNVVDKEKGY
jgi:phosphoglycerate dehydrogenase-like enzyme